MTKMQLEDAFLQQLEWTQLPISLRAACQEEESEFHRQVLEFTHKRHLAWHRTSLRHYMSESAFLQHVLRIAVETLAPYPYHYQDRLVRGEFALAETPTPFWYYRHLMAHLLQHGMTYEAIPSLTALDLMAQLQLG